MKKRSIFAVCLALLCVMMVTAIASAQETFWSAERVQIPPGEVVKVPASSSLKIKVKGSKHKLFATSCHIEGIEAFTNTLVNGIGETKSISFSCNEGVVITPLGLPWQTELTYPSWPLVDKWSGASLEVRKDEIGFGTFEGALLPQIGDADSQGVIEGQLVDDPDYALKFKLDNRLVEPSTGREMTLVGSYKLGKKGANIITGEVPGGFVYVGTKEESAITAAISKQHYRLALARSSGDDDDAG